MRKYIPYILILIILVGMFSPLTLVHAVTCDDNGLPAGCTIPTNTTCAPDDNGVAPPGCYQLLAPLPGMTDFDPGTKVGDNGALGRYLNLIIKLVIGISAALAVVMIVIGGIEYMTSELISGKERMTQAVLGLLIALGAYALLFTINPDLLSTRLNISDATVKVDLEEEIKGLLGQGKCEPVTNASNPCSPTNLIAAGFVEPRATQASSICNGESGGIANSASKTDVCSDGRTSFSLGLFQINVLANGNAIPACSNIFQTNGSGPQGNCLDRPADGICRKWDCSVKDTTKYQSCVNFITNTANNISFAKNLQASRGWGQWGFNRSCRFP